MEQKEMTDLLKRYKDGFCSPQEKARLETWYDMLVKSGEWSWTDQEKIETSNIIKKRISEQISDRPGVRTSKHWLWAAASILIFLLAGAIYQNLKAPVPETPVYAEKSVPPGQKIKFILSDGSVVFLNGSSTLKYPVKFSASSREVILVEGEAYFDIQHDKQRPFTVKTTGASIRVLGTAFNVRSYRTMEDILVTVSRGKVAVNNNAAAVNREVLLVRDEQVSINKQSGNLKKSHIESENITGWTEGKLIFNNESLANIGATLQYTRNVTIRFSDTAIASIQCSAGFDSTDSIEDIVSALSKANGLSYNIKNNEVFLKRK